MNPLGGVTISSRQGTRTALKAAFQDPKTPVLRVSESTGSVHIRSLQLSAVIRFYKIGFLIAARPYAVPGPGDFAVCFELASLADVGELRGSRS